METKQLHHQSDIDLLEFICNTNADELPYSIFVNRYIEDVEAECAKICDRRKLDHHIGQQIAHDAFAKIRKYRSFDKNKLRGNDERKAILGFIYIICINLFKDHHKKNIEPPTPISSYFDDLQNTLTFDVKDNKKLKDYTLRILKKLNPKEIRVLQTDVEYKRHHKYLPDEVVALLCKELGVKEPGIRKLRERLIVKIKKEIDVINGEQ